MAVSESLSQALDSAFADKSTPAGAPDGGSQSAASGSESSAAGGQQSSEGGTAASLIGLPAEQPAAAAGAEGGQAATQWKLAEGVASETVVAIGEDGKPITAGEVQAGYLRQSDYTQKTQAAAALKAQADEAIAWARQNEWFLSDIGSGDPARVQAALGKIAEKAGIQGSGFRGQGANQGSGGGAQGSGALAKIDPAQFEDHPLVTTVNSLIDALEARDTQIGTITKEIADFKTGVGKAMQAQEMHTALSAVEQEYKAAGLQGIDVQGAQTLVGKAITPAQAMQLAHFEKIIRHNLAIAGHQGPAGGGQDAGAAPNEPLSVGEGGADPTKMGLTEYINATIHSRK